MARVAVQFDGVSTGAKKAAAETRTAIKTVRDEATLTDKVAGKLGSTIKSALTVGAKVAGAGVLGLATAVGVAGVKFDDLRQKSQIAFTTMLGSGQKARAFLNELQAFANKTPFEFPDLIRASQRMLAMGFAAKQVVPSLTAIGDASAALGGSAETIDSITFALGQMQNAGRVSAQDMNQLTQAGVNGWGYLAAAAHKSVAQVRKDSENGLLDSRKAVQVILAGMERDYAGMMDKQSHTFSGLASTIKDTFTQVSGKVMRPFFDMATAGMQRIVDITGKPEFTAGVNRFADALSKKVKVAAEDVVGFFRDHWGEIQDDFLSLGRTAAETARDVKAIAVQANAVAHAIGGWDDAIKLALAAAVATKLAAFAGRIAAANGSAAALRGNLAALARIGVITIGIEFLIHRQSIKEALDNALVNARNYVHDKEAAVGLGFLTPGINDFGKGPFGTRTGADFGGGNFDDPTVTGGLGGLMAGGAGGSTATSKSVLRYAAKYGPGSGITYTWGGISPQTGFDCSGYLAAAYKAAGITIPHNAYLQFNDHYAMDTTGREQPGDGVYFASRASGKNSGPPPRHCGIYIGGGRFIEYFSSGQPAKVSNLADRGDYMGARRWVKLEVTPETDTGGTGDGFQDNGSLYGTGSGKQKKTPIVRGTSLLSNAVRTQIAHAGRTTSTADDLKAYGAALAELRGRLKTATGGQRTAIEEEITGIQKRINAINTKAYEDRLKKMAAETKKRLTEAKEAVQKAEGDFKTAYGRLAERAMDAFERETQKRLDKIDSDLKERLAAIDKSRDDLTPEEQAYKAFQDARQAAEDERKRKELASAVEAARKSLGALDATATADERAKLQADVENALQDQADFELDLRERTLQAQAEASRKARNDELDAQEQAARDSADQLKQQVQDERDIERQNFQDRIDDLEKFLLGRHLGVAAANDEMLKMMQEFGLDPTWFTSGQNAADSWIQGLAQAFADAGISLDALGARQDAVAAIQGKQLVGGPMPGTVAAAAAAGQRITHALPKFARGGKLPGQYVGLEDTMVYAGTPGEHVSGRELTAAMEDFFLRGGGRGGVGDVYLDGQKVGRIIAQPVQSEQARVISYRSSRA